MRKFIRLNTISRVSLGLASLVVLALLVVDFIFGVLPSEYEQERRIRQLMSEALSVQVSILAGSGSTEAMGHVLTETLRRQNLLESLAVRLVDGHLLKVAGNHDAHWIPNVNGESTLTHVSVPIMLSGRPWGALELAFQKPNSGAIFGFLSYTQIFWPFTVFVLSFALFYLYLRRVLQQLDPSAAVPDRVRSAYDVIVEGIAILDSHARVVLANSAFRNFDVTGQDPLGKRLEDLAWLRDAAAGHTGPLPWNMALVKKGATVDPQRINLKIGSDERTLVVSASPVLDARGIARGRLVVFLDRTEVERANDELQVALAQVQSSSQKISQQNEELQRLATRDPLTGCFNRRAFFDVLPALFEHSISANEPLCCIMTDIDHFKSFNDRYGHAIGDSVLTAVSGKLAAGLRDHDLLCRYGGEEFCIVLPSCSLTEAWEVAERLRRTVETQAGSSVRAKEPLKVTASFGLVQLQAGLDTGALIDQADQALYRAKTSGRNRVCVWEPEVSAVE